MKTLMIIADSVAMPRPELRSAYEETWPSLLKQAMPDWNIIENCRGGRTSAELLNLLNTSVLYYKPDILLIQLGIVDCAYRALLPQELELLEKFPLLPHLTRPLVKYFHHGITKLRRRNLISADDFYGHIVRFLQRLGNAQTIVYFIGILPPGKYMVNKNFGVRQNIMNYNKILRHLNYSNCFIDTSALDGDCLLPDGHHLSVEGHKKMASLILERLEEK